MAATIKGTIVLPSGSTVRLIDAGVVTNPRYVMEYASGMDGMGQMRWQAASSFTQADVIAILQSTGFIT